MPTKEIVSPPQIHKQPTVTNGVHVGKTASHELESEAGHIVSEEVYFESSVLPGFRLRVSDLYTLPQAPEMLDDPIYLPFSSPFVRAERVRTEQAEERARVAEERAAQEQARSAHYAAKLKSLGISLDEP